MLIKSEPCPWCGQEIESPHLTRGTCEHCGKPYRPVILLYNRYRTRRSEVPLLQAYAFYIITFLMFLYIAVRNSLRRSGIDFISIVFVVLYGTFFLFRRPKVYLAKVSLKEAESEKEYGVSENEANLGNGEAGSVGAAQKGIYIFLEGRGTPSFYHSRMKIQLLNQKDFSPSDFLEVTIHMREDVTGVFIETDENTPECLKSPGTEFRLFAGDYETNGVTMRPLDQRAGLFQAEFTFTNADFTPDKHEYYRAVMMLSEGDVPFHLIPNASDILENMISGKMVYEVMLFSPSMKARDLPIPAYFNLCRKDGTYLGGGTVTYHFANRLLFEETGTGVNTDYESRNRWL